MILSTRHPHGLLARLALVGRVAALVGLSVALALLVGACGDSGEAPTTGDFTGGATPAETVDETGDETGDTPLPGVPTVEILGLLGLEDYPELFCGTDVSILVGAVNIGDHPLRLVLSEVGSGDKVIISTAPEADPSAEDRWIFEFDGADLIDEDAPLGFTWEHGQSFTLMVAALTDLGDGTFELPTEPGLFDEWQVTLDALGPDIAVSIPDPAFEPPTLVGLADVAGVASDDKQMSHVEVYFDGDLKQTLPAGPDDEKQQVFNGQVDLRFELTDDKPFEIRAVDVCGNTGSWEVIAKVVRWPWLRVAETLHLPGPPDKPDKDPIIEDTAVLDWDGDGYNDVLFATLDGIRIALNDGEEAPGEFTNVLELTDDQTNAAAAADLDGDGDLDIIAVGTIKGGPVGKQLVVYRNQGDGTLLITEMHDPQLGADEVRGILVEDFSNDGRHDVALGTNAPDQTLIFFKRNSPEDQEFNDDQCVIVEAEPDADAVGGGDASVAGDAVAGELVCPTLLNGPFTAGGVEELNSMRAVDITGEEGVPDGFLDIIVGAEKAGDIWVYPNRFAKEGLLDTAFQFATGSPVYPQTTLSNLKPSYFCLGNFIDLSDVEDPEGTFEERDHLDLVVATESGSTWRVLAGIGNGQFVFKEPNEGMLAVDDDGDGAHDFDVFSMSGTIGRAVSGAACADFDSDGNMDFAFLSDDARLLQVWGGDGKGRFNQDPESKYINPANEGSGFVVQAFSRRLKPADFDNDGRPDLLLDYRGDGWSIYANTSSDDNGIDFHGTRALVTPLGKGLGGSGGVISLFEIGDVTMDGLPDVVATTAGGGFLFAPWLNNYHPVAREYRGWEIDGKDKESPSVFIWSQGTYTDDLPGWPASYDRYPRQVYPDTQWFGPVAPLAMRIEDVASAAVGDLSGPDGLNDIVLVGTPKSSTTKTKSHMQILVNIAAGENGFWDPDKILAPNYSTFRPFDGSEEVLTNVRTFEFINPDDDPIPGILVATDTGAEPPWCTSVPPLLRYCRWDNQKIGQGSTEDDPPAPYWDCWRPLDCDSFQDHISGGGAWDMLKIAVDGPNPGTVSRDPHAAGDILTLNQQGDSVTVFRWDDDPIDADFPFENSIEKAIGQLPKFMDLRDLDKDGILDLAATVDKNVFIAFGESGFEPFEAPVPVDRNDKLEQPGGVQDIVLTDVNADGFQDVVFTRKNTSVLAIYLSIGKKLNPDGSETALRQFHHAIDMPMCKTPSIVKAHAFGDDGCEDVFVLCENSGAIAMVINDTCDQQIAGADDEEDGG